jgi:ABC-type Na+ transport system ATPase subunit NatA
MLNQKMNPLETILYQKSSQTLWLYSSSKNVSFDIHKGNVYGILGQTAAENQQH